MKHPQESGPEAAQPERLDAVLHWLDRHLSSLSQRDAPWGAHLVRDMVEDLACASREGNLSLAWTPHGLEGDDVGPVIVLLSPQGAALASIHGSRARSRLPRTA